MKMKYKDYTFPSNPAVMKVEVRSDCHSAQMPDKSSVVENVSVCPAVIDGNGEFFAENGLQACDYLQHLLKEKTSGWLFAPSLSPVKAFLTEFSYEQDAKTNAYRYKFRFVEDCNDKTEQASLSYTTALEGENAFDIADKYNISIDRLMELNDFITPFDITEGDRVVLK